MSANTSFSTTNSKLNLFISKQTLTNNQISSDLSSTEFPLIEAYPIFINREFQNKITNIGIYPSNSGQSGYLTTTDFNIFSGKLSGITSGTNIYATPSGTSPTVSLAISSTVDMCNQSITNLSSEDFKTNIDIRQAGYQRIYNSGTNMIISPSGELILKPSSNVSITSNVVMNSKTVDMCGGVITGISNEDFSKELDIRLKGKQMIYTTNGSDMSIDASGILNIKSVMNMNGNQLNMTDGDIKGIKGQYFKGEVNIYKGLTNKNIIYTNANDMTIYPDGTLYIGSPIDMCGNEITNILYENYKTNIDIRQNGTPRIFTTALNDMTINAAGKLTLAPVGNITISSAMDIQNDVSMNARTIDMESGFITGISNENYKTNIDIRQAGSKRIYTTGNRMIFDTSGLTILSDVSMNNNSIIDISGLYSISGEILRIDASNISFTYGTQTHVVIDNCGIILNDISSSNTGTVLTFDTTTNRVNYYPLYDTSSFLIDLSGGSLGTNKYPFTMKISRIGNTVTMGIPDISGVFSNVNDIPYIYTNPAIDSKYRPTSNISFPALIYNNGAIRNGKALLRNDGYMRFYTNVIDASSSWVQDISGGLVNQCFTYHTF